MASTKLKLIFVIAASMSASSFAQRIVYDPQNHAENIITAIKTAAILTTTDGTWMEGRLANYGGYKTSDSFAKSVEMQELLGVLDSVGQMNLALREGKVVFDNIQNVFGASPYKKWEDFAANIGARKQSGDKQATMLLDSAFAADQQIRKAYEANRKIMSSMNALSGVTQAVQATVNAVSTVIDQNAAMLYTMSSQAKGQAHEFARQAKEREQQETSIKDYKDAAKRAYEADAKLLGTRSR